MAKWVEFNNFQEWFTSWYWASHRHILGLGLIHLPLNQMAAFVQTTFLDIFCRMEILLFWLKCLWRQYLLGVAVTKPISPVLLFSEFFSIAKNTR